MEVTQDDHGDQSVYSNLLNNYELLSESIALQQLGS